MKKVCKNIKNWLRQKMLTMRTRLLPQGLLYRFILIILVPLLFLQAAVLIVFFDRHWSTVSHRLARDVTGEIGIVAQLIQKEEMPLSDIGLVVAEFNRELLGQMRFEGGAKINTANKLYRNATSRILIAELKNLGYPFSLYKTDKQQTALAIQLDDGVLHAVLPKKRFFSSTVYVFLAGMFGFSILLFGIAFLFMKNQLRAIVRLSHAAELFGRGQPIDSFKPEGATEVRQAGLSFIQMRNRIQRYLTERTGMLSGVSHDLKTPLTRMKLQLSMMKQTDEIRDLQKDVTEMEHMLEAYLAFARGDGKEMLESVNISALVKDLVQKLSKSGQAIVLTSKSKIMCLCRPTEISRAVMNLLTNAGRYAKHTQVTLTQTSDAATIIIDDDGPGIPLKHRSDVFRAFYRIEPSRNKKTGGIGLGLTIARDIVLSHGGDITLSDSPNGGLRATIVLPITGQTTEVDA